MTYGDPTGDTFETRFGQTPGGSAEREAEQPSVAETLWEREQEAEETLRSVVRSHPWLCLGASVALGFVAARLVRAWTEE